MIVLYGGAFDPPHHGHVDAAKAATARFRGAQLWVVPGAAPAGASGAHKAPAASFDDRCAMCDIAFADVPGATVSRIERSMPAPNYTVKTLQEVARSAPGEELVLLVGGDQLASFPQWRSPDEILRLAKLAVVARGATASNVPHDVVSGPVSDAASSAIRQALARKEDVPAGWLHPGVRQYIEEHSLYQGASS